MKLLKFYIPTTDKNGNKIDYVPLLKYSVASLCIYFGAVSVYKVNGILKNKKGIFYVVESNSSWTNIKNYRKDIEELARKIKVDLKQELVCYVLGTKFFTV